MHFKKNRNRPYARPFRLINYRLGRGHLPLKWIKYIHSLQVATKVYQLAATDLRLDDNYVLWYSNIARLIVTGVIPLGSLAYLNFRIYSVVSLSLHVRNGDLRINNPVCP